MRKATKRIIVHHTAGHLSDTLTMVRQWHKEKRFLDAYGHSGYHFFIDGEGKLLSDRPEDDVGCAVKNANHDSISIALAGNFNWNVPNPAQINALITLLIRLVKKYSLQYWNIYGHRDVKRFFILNTTSTNCPGNNLYKMLPEIRQRVAMALIGGKANE